MKKLLFICISLFAVNANAQAPEKMSYQAVIRNPANVLVTNQSVGMTITILQGSVAGSTVYAEVHTATTNTNGLVSLEIGGGISLTGTFASINWAGGPYFIKTETDPAGGTSYTITGTSQLLSTPYALAAKNGIPTGGAANQVLAKVNGTNFNTKWVTSLPQSYLGHSLGTTAAAYINPFSDGVSSSVNRNQTVFLPANTTIIANVYSNTVAFILDLIAVTPITTSSTNWTPGAVQTSLSVPAYTSGNPTTGILTFTTTIDGFYAFRTATTVSVYTGSFFMGIKIQ